MIKFVHRTSRALAIGASLLCVGIAPAALAEPSSAVPPPPTFEWHDVKSPSGGDYRVIVWLPKGPAPASGYPVVYVLDGNAWGPLVADFIKVNESDNVGLSRVKSAIVVGIGYPIDQPFDISRRVLDLTTPAADINNVVSDRNGGYAHFISFIQSVVKPDIERRYRIDRTQQTLLGHSLGGLFVLRTLLAHPSDFQNYVALSPSIWWGNAALLKDIEGVPSGTLKSGDTHVYLGVGELEQYSTPESHQKDLKYYRSYTINHPEILKGRSIDAMVDALEEHNKQTKMVDNARDMAAALKSKGYITRFDKFPDEDHMSVFPSEIGRALPFVLKP